MKQKYFSEEERIVAEREKCKRWREKHPIEAREKLRRYREKHSNELKIRKKLWREKHPIEARASNLLQSYNQKDKKYGRGEGDLTTKWIIENIFTKSCAHCGKTGWEVIGCNRIDNSKPHTMDNVEPCCFECNCKLSREEVSKKVYQYTLDDEIVNVWESVKECGRNGFNVSCISECCNFKQKTHKGYKWSFEPL